MEENWERSLWHDIEGKDTHHGMADVTRPTIAALLKGDGKVEDRKKQRITGP